MTILREYDSGRGPERRRPADREYVSFNREAIDAALRVGEAAYEQLGLRDALALGGLEMIRKLREIARRGATYLLGCGEKLEGVHVVDVQVALHTFHHYAGSDASGPLSEDAMARALAAAYVSKERREARELSKCRRIGRRDSDMYEMREEVAQRVERHRAGVLLERAGR
jgi:hypothetical protein